jgi:hypothetical protein
MRITSRVFKGDAAGIRESVRGAYYPMWPEMVQIVRDYQRMARERKDHWWAHADLQLHLTISLRAELETLRMLRADQEGKEPEKENHFIQQITKSTINAFTQIADGIAHRFLGYDYALCQALVGNATSPFAITQSGFFNVLEVAAHLNDITGPGGQVLLCDLNSITNEGDLIIRRGHEFEVVEVKQGERARGARLSRQLERLENLTALVNDGIGEVDGLPVQFLDLPARNHRVEDLANGFARALETGYSVQQLSEYQSITCIDPRGMTGEDMADLFESILQETEAESSGRHVFELSSLDGRQLPGLIAPFTTMPIDNDLIVDLLMGQRIFISTINLDRLCAYIESVSGFKVVDLSKEARTEGSLPPGVLVLIDPTRHAKNFFVPIEMLVEASMNLIDMGCYLESGKVMMDASKEVAHWIPRYANEEHLWD